MIQNQITIPKVSICIFTYNQEHLIRECLMSVVMQNIDFPIEVIISDDCSTDDTPKIISEFAKKYHYIKPILRTKNIGPYKNMVETYKICKGKYVAHLDGDDYWLDNKLSDQFNFMEKNTECVISWTRSFVKKGDSIVSDSLSKKMLVSRFNQKDLAQLITIGFNSSKMFKNHLSYDVKVNFDIVDYYLNIEKLNFGYAAFIGDTYYTVYRAGIGIASNGIKTKIILNQTWIYLLKKYPYLKASISAAMLLNFFLAIKNRNIELIKSMVFIVMKNFSIRGAFLIFFNIKKILALKLPKI